MMLIPNGESSFVCDAARMRRVYNNNACYRVRFCKFFEGSSLLFTCLRLSRMALQLLIPDFYFHAQ